MDKQYIYLTTNNSNNDIFKIGYTTNIFKRRNHYKSHNPDNEIKAYEEVPNKIIENLIHTNILKKGYTRFSGKEWFKGNLEIKDFRDITKHTINEHIKYQSKRVKE